MRSALLMNSSCRLERLTASAEELTSKTGQKCIPLQADVRFPEQLKEAVEKCVDEVSVDLRHINPVIQSTCPTVRPHRFCHLRQVLSTLRTTARTHDHSRCRRKFPRAH